MKKYICFLLAVFIFGIKLYPQQYKFAWITDLHVGSQEANENVIKVVDDINKKDFRFVLISGDITGAGSNKDLETAKGFIDKLKVKYYILPGNHDTKRSESGCTKFASLWGDDKFNIEKEGIHFIGLNSAICFRGHGGHLAPETLDWLKQTLTTIDMSEPLVIVMHHLMSNQLDNWFELVNLIRDHNVIALLCGHGHANAIDTLNGLPVIMARATLSNKNGWGYCSVSVTNDSLSFCEENGDYKQTKLYSIQKSKKNNISKTDSLQFINYNTKVIADINLKKTLVSGIFADSNYIAASAFDGSMYCYDLNGHELWNYKTNDSFIGSPVVIGDYFVAASVQGNVYSFNCKTGQLNKKIKLDEIVTARLSAKTIINEKEKTNAVFIGSASGAMYCLEAATLKQIWQNNLAQGVIEDEPLVLGNRLFYGSWDSYFNCCDFSTGKTIWRWQGDNKFYFSPAACKPVSDNENIFIATPDNFVSSININTGKTNWRSNQAPCWESIGLSTDNSKIFVKGVPGKFYFVNSTDGKILDSLKYQNNSETMCSEIIESGGRVLFTTQNGMVNSIENYSILKPLLFLGTSRAHKVIQLKNDTFTVSNLDGHIIVFNLN